MKQTINQWEMLLIWVIPTASSSIVGRSRAQHPNDFCLGHVIFPMSYAPPAHGNIPLIPTGIHAVHKITTQHTFVFTFFLPLLIDRPTDRSKPTFVSSFHLTFLSNQSKTIYVLVRLTKWSPHSFVLPPPWKYSESGKTRCHFFSSTLILQCVISSFSSFDNDNNHVAYHLQSLPCCTLPTFCF
jgi:hypothetical protein